MRDEEDPMIFSVDFGFCQLDGDNFNSSLDLFAIVICLPLRQDLVS